MAEMEAEREPALPALALRYHGAAKARAVIAGLPAQHRVSISLSIDTVAA